MISPTVNARPARLSILVALLSSLGIAQTASLSLSSGSGAPGSVVTLSLVLSGTTTPAALEWTVTYPTADIASLTIVGGPVATAAGKTVTCNSTAGTATCDIWGMNSNPISNGIVASLAFTVSAATKDSVTVVQLSNGDGASSAGSTVSTSSAGSTVTITQAPVIGSAPSASGTVGTPFSYQIGATNSPASYGATGLPAGLSVNTSTGLISGTPASAALGTWNVTLSATNGSGTGNANLNLTIQAAGSGPPWYNSSWAHRKQVTIAHTQVSGGAALTNFPVLYSVAGDANLAAEAQPSGNDLLFTASDGVTKLNHQIESYNSSTGQLVAWVQIPALSNSADTVIYIYYGNASASSQQNPTGTWDSSYSGVWHLPDGTTLSANDSTANGNNGVISSPVATGGEIGGGASFNGSSDGISFNPIGNLVQTYTAEFWVNSSFPHPYMTILGGASSFNDIYFDGSGNAIAVDNGTSFRAYSTAIVTGVGVPSNTWTSLAVTRSGSGISVYKNGALVGSGTFSTPYNAANFAEMGNGSGINFYGGKLDEVRISSSVRSAGWIQTEFNNESSPASFLSVGSEQTGGGTSSTVSITVTTAPAGLALTVDSTPCTAPCSFQWTPTSTHTIAVTTSPQAGGAGTQYVYASWSDGMGQSHSITVPSSAASYTANFTTQYMLTTLANPPAGGIVSPASGWFNSGTPIDLTAVANTGYTFSGFTGTTSSSTSPLNFSLTAPITETANFSTGTSGPGWYNTSWAHRKQVTIAHTQVSGGSALANFPVLYSVASDSNLAAEAQTTGNDILFTASDGVTKLNHQIESYNSSTGQLVAWVQIPSLANSADTVIYIYYGNASAASQQNPASVWDSNYAGVWHLPNGTTLSANDSTANGHNGTISSPVAIAGEIGGGASFNGSSDGVSFSPISNLAQTYTAEFWINSSFPHPYMTILGGSSGFNDIYFDGSKNTIGVDNGTSFSAYSTASVSGLNVASNAWTSLAVTRSGSSISVYKNGTLMGTGTFSTPYNTANFAEMGSAGGINFYGGKLDEVRVSSNVRSAGWIQTEYNNESSPATFLSVASEQSNGNTVATPTFSVPGGAYSSAQSVTISTGTTGASIRYTTNGTAPSETVGTLYSGSVTVSSSETLMAIAYETGLADSSVASATYTIGSTGPTWYNASWNFRKPITVNSGQVNGTLTNFPMLYSVTDANLVGNTQAGGNDILFTASDGVTKLNHQIESYNSATGQLLAWVQVPALQSGTVIYVYYGNALASSQQNPASVWDSNYAGVWHLPNGTTLSANDSTANGHNGTISSPVAIAGEIGGGASFNGSSDGVSFSPISNLAQTYTAEFWINSSFPHPYMTILGGSSGFNDIYFDGSKNTIGVDNGTSFSAYSTASVSGLNVASNAWTSLAVTRSGSSISVYKNGTLMGTGTFSTPYNTANFAEMGNAGGVNFYSGKLDEVRVSSSIRSAGWIQTEYNNEISPASFLSVGAAQSSSGGNTTASMTAGVIRPNTGTIALEDTVVVSTGSDWYDAAWTNRKAITINTGQVSGTLTNFPMLYSVTDPGLIGTTQMNGNDILFTASDGVTKLHHEIESFDGATGTLVAWVKVPALEAGTVIYVYWGNSGAPNQQSAPGVWDSNFDMVQHFGNGSTLSTSDSTRNQCNASTLSCNSAGAGRDRGCSELHREFDRLWTVHRAEQFRGTNHFVMGEGPNRDGGICALDRQGVQPGMEPDVELYRRKQSVEHAQPRWDGKPGDVGQPSRG